MRTNHQMWHEFTSSFSQSKMHFSKLTVSLQKNIIKPRFCSDLTQNTQLLRSLSSNFSTLHSYLHSLKRLILQTSYTSNLYWNWLEFPTVSARIGRSIIKRTSLKAHLFSTLKQEDSLLFSTRAGVREGVSHHLLMADANHHFLKGSQ